MHARKESNNKYGRVFLTQAHYTVLQNFSLVAPYIEEHMNIVRSKNLEQSDSSIILAHMATFGSWLQTHLMNNTTIGDQLYLFARLPSSYVLSKGTR